jgi:hypothetical protein
MESWLGDRSGGWSWMVGLERWGKECVDSGQTIELWLGTVWRESDNIRYERAIIRRIQRGGLPELSVSRVNK